MSSREEIEKANLAFIYGHHDETAQHDPDKRSFVKSKRVEKDDSIKGFEGEFSFLAADFPCVVHLAGCDTPFPSLEHALQGSKTSDPELHTQLNAISDTRELKRTALRLFKNTEKWNIKSVVIAEQLLRDKFFRSKPLCAKLMATEHRDLINTNTFQEKFWGKCNNVGQNKLGKLSEKVRLCIEQGRLQELWLRDHFQLEDAEKISISVTVKRNGEVLTEFGQIEERKNMLEVGKAVDNDILLDHPTASRFHAMLLVDRVRGLLLLDLRAANGTRVDSKPISPLVPVELGKDGTKTVHFAASSREYTFTLDSSADVKRSQSLYARLATGDSHPASSNGSRNSSSGRSGGGGGGGKDSHTSPDTTVFVANLAYTCTEAELKTFFTACGEVACIKIPRDRETGEGRGIAFVTFEKIAGLYQALTRDGDEVGGREVKIRRSEAKGGKGGGAGGGGGGGRRNESKDYSTNGGDAGHYGPSAQAPPPPPSSADPRSSAYSHPSSRSESPGKRGEERRSERREREQYRQHSDSDESESEDRWKRSARRDRDRDRDRDRSRDRDRDRDRDGDRRRSDDRRERKRNRSRSRSSSSSREHERERERRRQARTENKDRDARR